MTSAWDSHLCFILSVFLNTRYKILRQKSLLLSRNDIASLIFCEISSVLSVWWQNIMILWWPDGLTCFQFPHGCVIKPDKFKPRALHFANNWLTILDDRSFKTVDRQSLRIRERGAFAETYLWLKIVLSFCESKRTFPLDSTTVFVNTINNQLRVCKFNRVWLWKIYFQGSFKR